MKRVWYSLCLIALAWAQCGSTAAQDVDLRRGVPEDAYIVVYGKHNPERDFQRQYYADVWKTVRETRVLERASRIIASRMEADQVDQVNHVLDELRQAVAPIDLRALGKCQESAYAQVQQTSPVPVQQHLVLLRTTADAARTTAQGIKNLFDLAEKYSGGELSVEESKVGAATVWDLELPPQSPYQPAVACLGEVVAFSTSRDVLTNSLERMDGGTGASKFDDPRLAAALQHLPEPEDGLVIYDGKTQFAGLRGIQEFLETTGGDDENVQRVTKLLGQLWDDIGIIDFYVAVSYTEDNLNRTAGYGTLVAGSDEATLRKMLSGGELFDQWSTWVPAGAVSYSLCTGVSLHPLYERIMAVLREDVPEAAPRLARFEEVEKQLDFYLDRDLLQSFSGEHVSVSLPAGVTGGLNQVFALRCHNPERIKELIHRGIAALQQIKPVRDQQLRLEESADLPGFEELNLVALAALRVKPVLGFQDGWMYIGTNADSVKKVLETRAGQGETIAETEAFTRLKLDISGPVRSIRYRNTAENIRNVAQMLNQISLMAPMLISMGGGTANPEDLKPILDLVGLLPDIAKIVKKFDFLQANAQVMQLGEEPGSFVSRSVLVVRPAGN